VPQVFGNQSDRSYIRSVSRRLTYTAAAWTARLSQFPGSYKEQGRELKRNGDHSTPGVTVDRPQQLPQTHRITDPWMMLGNGRLE
jgi:hypothetical protein